MTKNLKAPDKLYLTWDEDIYHEWPLVRCTNPGGGRIEYRRVDEESQDEIIQKIIDIGENIESPFALKINKIRVHYSNTKQKMKEPDKDMPLYSSALITTKAIDGPTFVWLVTRVQNGWIYTSHTGLYTTSVFVPENPSTL